MRNVKLLIIGAGPGGYVAAIRASQLGLEPVVVEADEVGGTCLNWGCIPTKALVAAAETYENAKNSESMGIISNPTFSWEGVVTHAKNTVLKNRKGVEYLFKKNKIESIKGRAKFVGEKEVEVNGESIVAENIIIATGSSVRSFPSLPLDGKTMISSDEALFLDALPKSILIVGAGAIGLEFGYIFNAFGSEIHIVEAMDRFLPSSDADVSKDLLRAFKKKKIKCYPKTMTEKIEKTEDGYKVTLSNGKEIDVERILVAVGRKANTESLDPEKGGIKLTDRGFVEINDKFETSVKGVYAIGDVKGAPMLAHIAEHEGIALTEMLAGGEFHSVNYFANPACTYCEPSVADIGMTEQQAEEKGIEYVTGKFPFSANGKAISSGKTAGFVKIIAEKESKTVIGAHIIGHGATDLISEFLPIINNKMTLDNIIHSIHPHPTLCEASLEAALDALNRTIHI